MRSILSIGSFILACYVGFASAGDVLPTGATHRSYLALPKGGEISSLPYVWQRTMGIKHLVVLGTRHNRDPHSPMYVQIERELRLARPQILIHESVIPDDLLRQPQAEAIARGADLGFAANLAANLGANLRSGDAPPREEIEGLLKTHTAQEIFVFLVAQRFIGSGRHLDAGSLGRDYPSFVRDYLDGNGAPLESEWRTWKGFCEAFANVTGHPFSTSTWDPKILNPLYKSGALSDVVRSSEELRDAHLFATIRDELRLHDRVAVVFGYWHVLAIEPELGELLPSQ